MIFTVSASIFTASVSMEAVKNVLGKANALSTWCGLCWNLRHTFRIYLTLVSMSSRQSSIKQPQ